MFLKPDQLDEETCLEVWSFSIFSWLVGWSIGPLVHWSVGESVSPLVGALVSKAVVQLVGWLVG